MFSSQISHQQVIVRSATDNAETVFCQFLGQTLSILHNLLRDCLELVAGCILKGPCFRCHGVELNGSQRSREGSFIQKFCVLSFTEHHTASCATESLCGGRSHKLRMGNRAWDHFSGNQACHVSHVHHKVCAYLFRNFCDALIVDQSGIGAGPCDNQFRLIFFCFFFQCIVINQLRLRIHRIELKVIDLAHPVCR